MEITRYVVYRKYRKKSQIHLDCYNKNYMFQSGSNVVSSGRIMLPGRGNGSATCAQKTMDRSPPVT